jgi:regulator of protease activity HflC (stomatin/prohibitin superfamily)
MQLQRAMAAEAEATREARAKIISADGEFKASKVWHYRLWSFNTRDTKLERFLHENQHTQRKLLKFENWTNGEPQ